MIRSCGCQESERGVHHETNCAERLNICVGSAKRKRHEHTLARLSHPATRLV